MAKSSQRVRSAGRLAFPFVVAFAATAVVYCSSKERSMDHMMNVKSERKAKAAEETADDMPYIDPKTAFFDFDKSVLRPDARKALKPTAEWLKKYPSVNVQIEGFCDEKGSNAYNLVLGEKRANAAKAYLVSQGVEPSRIATLSYGRVEGSGDEVRRQNRRAGFIIIHPSDSK